jgi:hypothetical protein
MAANIRFVSTMLASDLTALAVAIAAVAIGSILSPRVRSTVFELGKGPWYVPSTQAEPALGIAAPIQATASSFWTVKAGTLSAVATAIVVLQAGVGPVAPEVATNRTTMIAVAVLETEA